MSLPLHFSCRAHPLPVRILGELGSFTGEPESWLFAFIVLQGKSRLEAEKLDLFGSSRGAAGCAGHCPAPVLGQVLIFQSDFITEHNFCSKLSEEFSFLSRDPAVPSNKNWTQATLQRQQQILTRGFRVLQVTQRCQGVSGLFFFPFPGGGVGFGAPQGVLTIDPNPGSKIPLIWIKR